LHSNALLLLRYCTTLLADFADMLITKIIYLLIPITGVTITEINMHE